MINDFNPDKRLNKAPQAVPDERTNAPIVTTPEAFHTPDEVAAQQNLEATTATALKQQTDANHLLTERTRKSYWSKLNLSWPPGKKEWLAAAVVVVLIGGGSGAWALTHHKAKVVPKPKTVVVQAVAPAPVTVPSALTGLLVNPNLNQGPVTAVMIENSIDARPQSGLSQAGVVFEAIAEGGITRFLALFQDTAPDNVGPIRSARPYYLQWALGFDAGYAHVGGSPEAITDIKDWGVRDLDQFYNSASYHRVSSRVAPHNVYTAIATLNQLEASKGYTSSAFTSFPRKAEAPAKLPTAANINLNFSGPLYNVLYQYDVTTNSYFRSEGGAPHIDANTSTQLKPKVVIALVIPYSLGADGQHSVYNTIGSGSVYVFQDGIVATGQWAKSSNSSQFIFTDANGAIIKLNPGQTWLTAVANATDVTFAP